MALCASHPADQLKSVHMDTFHNFWDAIHDYTPHQRPGLKNWK